MFFLHHHHHHHRHHRHKHVDTSSCVVCVCTALLRRRHVTPLVGTPPHTVDIDTTANRNQLSVTVSPVCQSDHHACLCASVIVITSHIPLVYPVENPCFQPAVRQVCADWSLTSSQTFGWKACFRQVWLISTWTDSLNFSTRSLVCVGFRPTSTVEYRNDLTKVPVHS